MSATTILLILLFALPMGAMHRRGHSSHSGGGGGHPHSHSTGDADRSEETGRPLGLPSGRPPATPSTDHDDDEHEHAAHGAA